MFNGESSNQDLNAERERGINRKRGDMVLKTTTVDEQKNINAEAMIEEIKGLLSKLQQSSANNLSPDTPNAIPTTPESEAPNPEELSQKAKDNPAFRTSINESLASAQAKNTEQPTEEQPSEEPNMTKDAARAAEEARRIAIEKTAAAKAAATEAEFQAASDRIQRERSDSENDVSGDVPNEYSSQNPDDMV